MRGGQFADIYQDVGLPRWLSDKKNPPVKQEMQDTEFRSLDREDPLEEEMATHSVFLPGESQGQGSLLGCCPWGRTELDMTEVT